MTNHAIGLSEFENPPLEKSPQSAKIDAATNCNRANR